MGPRAHSDGASRHITTQWGGQTVTVFLMAFVEMLLRRNEVVYAPFYALFLAGSVAILAESWLDAQKASLDRTAAATPS